MTAELNISRLMFRSSEGLLDVPEPDLVTGSVGEGGGGGGEIFK